MNNKNNTNKKLYCLISGAVKVEFMFGFLGKLKAFQNDSFLTPQHTCLATMHFQCYVTALLHSTTATSIIMATSIIL